MGAIVLTTVSGEAIPSAASFAWAAAAGASGVGGLAFFYYALSRGTMGVVAPLAALIGAGLPVLLAVVGGEAVPPARAIGIAVALVAVVLISLPGGERGAGEKRNLRADLRELPLVALAGLGFAGFFIFADRATTAGETWWPLIMVRVVGLAVVLAILAGAALRVSGQPMRVRLDGLLGLTRIRSAPVGPLYLGALFAVVGLGDLAGNAFFLLAKQADAFSVAVVLSSLYPIVTTILAAIVLHERLRPLQVVGVVLATVSVPLLR